MINTINNKVFRTANVAYEYLHDQILQNGVAFGDTKALFNVGFYITDPKNRKREFNSDSGRHKYTKEQLDYLFGHRHCLRKGPGISKITQDFNIKFSTNVSEMAIRMKIRRMLHSRKRK